MYEIKLANVLWDRPFNLQGGGQVFYPKNIFILNLGKKKKIWPNTASSRTIRSKSYNKDKRFNKNRVKTW
jgi:hypothetical protein